MTHAEANREWLRQMLKREIAFLRERARNYRATAQKAIHAAYQDEREMEHFQQQLSGMDV